MELYTYAQPFPPFRYDFASFVFPSTHFHVPSYLAWFMAADLTPTYHFIRWQLKYLQVMVLSKQAGRQADRQAGGLAGR